MGYDPFLLYYAIEQDFWMSGQFGGNFSFNNIRSESWVTFIHSAFSITAHFDFAE